MESRHIACHHGKGSDQSQPAAQSPQAVSAKPYAHGPLPADVRRSRRLDVVNDAHGAGETLAPPPLETAGIDGTLLELAGDAVPVPIQLFTVSRVAPMQGGRTRLLRLLAVGKVRALLLRLLGGRGSRCATTGLRRRLWCRLGLLRRRWRRRLRPRGLRRRNRRRRRTRGRGWGGTRSRRRRGSRSR